VLDGLVTIEVIKKLGDDFKGYVFKITGGNDKEGFPMKQGVLTAARVRLLVSKGHSCYRPRKRGERKRRSVRGCIVSADLSVLNLAIVKKGDGEIPGLTDTVKPRRLGPKRASHIRKLFNLDKDDDVRQYVIRRQIVKEGKKPYNKAPKIQRLITPQRLQHKRRERAIKKERWQKTRKDAEEYNTLLAKRLKEQREARYQRVAKKRDHQKSVEAQKSVEVQKPVQKKPTTKGDKKQAEKKPEKKAEKAAPAKPAADKKPAAAAKPADKDKKPAGKPADKKPAAAPADKKPAGGDKKAAQPASKKGGKGGK